MVAPEEISQQSDNTGGAFGKFKQTLSSSLLTAQDKGILEMQNYPELITKLRHKILLHNLKLYANFFVTQHLISF